MLNDDHFREEVPPPIRVAAVGQSRLNRGMTDTAAPARPAATRRRTGRIVFWVIFAAAAASLVAAFFWGSQTVSSFTEPWSSMGIHGSARE